MVWMQYAVDTVCSGCSGIVVYGGGNIVFDAKRSNQWIQSHSGHNTQWMQYAVDAVCSGIVLCGGGDIVFDTKSSNQWPQGIVLCGGGDIVFDTKRSNQWIQWMQYAVE